MKNKTNKKNDFFYSFPYNKFQITLKPLGKKILIKLNINIHFVHKNLLFSKLKKIFIFKLNPKISINSYFSSSLKKCLNFITI